MTFDYWLILHMVYLTDAFLFAFLVFLLAVIARNIYDKIEQALQGFIWG